MIKFKLKLPSFTFILIFSMFVFVVLPSEILACSNFFYAIKCDPKKETIDIEVRKIEYCDDEPKFIKKKISYEFSKKDLIPKVFYLSSDYWGIADFKFPSKMTARVKAGWYKTPRPYGEGGAYQGYKLSLWINKVKVLSSTQVVKASIDSQKIRFWDNVNCKSEKGWHYGECGDVHEMVWEKANQMPTDSHAHKIPLSKIEKYFKMQEIDIGKTRDAIDKREYPASSSISVSDNRIVILYAVDNKMCKDLLNSSEIEDFIRIPEKWQQRVMMPKTEQFFIQDIDNDGKEEIIYLRSYFYSHRYGSTLYVFDKKGEKGIVDFIGKLESARLSLDVPERWTVSEKIEQDLLKIVQHKYPHEWADKTLTIKAKSAKGIEFDVNNTFLEMFVYRKISHVLLYADDELNLAKKFMVIKPQKNNNYEEICIYTKVEPNF